MAARLFVQRRRVWGLRLLALGVLVPVGLALVVGLPIAAGLAVEWARRAVAAPQWAAALFGFAAVVGAIGVGVSVTSRAIDRALALRMSWGHITIGNEGVRWNGWTRPVLTRWRDVHGTISEGDALVLVTRDGVRVALVTSDAAALGEAVAVARAEHAAKTRAEIPNALASDGDVREWIERARGLLSRDAYRANAPPEALERVLADPDAPATARLGAAAALLPSDPTRRARVAEIREETVDEELAQALHDLLEERIVPARWAKLARRG